MKKLIMLLAAFSTMIVGCGKSNQSSSATTTTTPITPTSTSLAYCNQATSSPSTTQIQLTAVSDNNQLRTDIMRLRFSKIVSSFFQSGTVIQFFRWKASSDNTTYIDTGALPIRVLNLSTGSEIYSSTGVTYADVQSAISNQDMSNLLFVVDLKDVNAEYDVVRTVIYTSSGIVVDNLDALIPAFSANPAEYAKKYDGTVRSSLLQALHPFKSQLNSSTTTAQFASQSQSYCF